MEACDWAAVPHHSVFSAFPLCFQQCQKTHPIESMALLTTLQSEQSRWPYYDPEFHTLNQRINPSSVEVDNRSCPSATIIKVDSQNKNGILAEMIQAFSNLDLTICKAHISSEGSWFMDDRSGNKFTNEELLIDHIHEALGSKQTAIKSQQEETIIELIGKDRTGLVSEISAVLKDMDCNVVAADIWTHNSIIAASFHVTDFYYGGTIKDSLWLSAIHNQLSKLLSLNLNLPQESIKELPSVRIHASCTRICERKMHQLMLAYQDYDCPLKSGEPSNNNPCSCTPALVFIEDCQENQYSVINVRCKDRPRLLYDIVCTITDMNYVIFHATIDSNGPNAIQDYYIRHIDGRPIETEGEKQRLIKCMKAAIKRRVSEGGKFALCVRDEMGLLSDVTRIIRENGLSITRAKIRTEGDLAINVFYVKNAFGGTLDPKDVEAVKSQLSKYASTLELDSQLLFPFPAEEVSPISISRRLSCEFEYENHCHCRVRANAQSRSSFAKLFMKLLGISFLAS